jgi:predicted RNase H-like HicB family nuclease
MRYLTFVQMLADDDETHYVAIHPQLNIEAYGNSPEEAKASLDVVREVYLEDLAQRGEVIPESHGLSSSMSLGGLPSGKYEVVRQTSSEPPKPLEIELCVA